jgi:hypothetical protein
MVWYLLTKHKALSSVPNTAPSPQKKEGKEGGRERQKERKKGRKGERERGKGKKEGRGRKGER